MKCPHCKEDIYREDLPDIGKAEEHAKHYGSGFTTSICPICHKKFRFYAELKVVIYEPHIACDSDYLSFG